MCAGVEFRAADKVRKLYFAGENAALPVLLEDGEGVEWIRWGRRKTEKSSAPPGGWARLTAIRAGDWNMYSPRQGVVTVDRFLQGERASALRGRRLSQWVDVPRGQGVQCLVIGEGEDRRAYIVTTSPPAKCKLLGDRWPSLVDLPATPPMPMPSQALVTPNDRPVPA